LKLRRAQAGHGTEAVTFCEVVNAANDKFFGSLYLLCAGGSVYDWHREAF
jgi:hypothetical protein